MREGRRRTKSQGKSSASNWFLATHGLHHYYGDEEGVFRNWKGGPSEFLWHNSPSHPGMPLDGNTVFWLFRKSGDVSSDAWDITEVGSGTQLALQDERGGVAKATPGAADNNYQQYFSKSEIVQIGSTGVVVYEVKVRVADVDQADMFVGLCSKLGSGNIFDNRVDAIGFYLADGGATIYGITEKAGASLATGLTTLADDTWVRLGINISCNPDDSTKYVNYFVNRVLYETHDVTEGDRVPTEAMCFAFGIRNGQASANGFSIATPAYIIMDD